MAYIIDGHNLIPKIPGFSLQDIDDENRLILLLQAYARQTRKTCIIYFDKAQPGQIHKQKAGLVTAYFVTQNQTADMAIQAHLIRLGQTARNWTVVSSDQAVINSAHLYHARSIKSEAFAKELIMLSRKSLNENDRPEPEQTPEEIDAWLKAFTKRKKGR